MLSIHTLRPAHARAFLAVCGGLALSACASHYAQVPARLDLQPYGKVALVTFTTEETNRDLSALTTQRFAEALLASQSGVELLELSTADSLLRQLAVSGDAAALAQAIGREKHVPAVFLGHITASGVTPRGRLSASGVSMKATVSAALTVKLISTSTGGTLWRSSSEANGTVGRLAVSGALPSVAMRDPKEAYGEVVGELVRGVTRDMRPTWVKQ